MEKTTWLKVKIAEKGKTLTDEQIFNTLYELLSETGFVKNIDILKKDIQTRENKGCTKLTETLFVPHTKTEGVSHFCAAILIIPDEMICTIMAWPHDSNYSLTRTAALLSVSNRLSEPSSLAVLGSVADLPAYINSLLEANGVSSTDFNPEYK